jgi:predicted MPP superfamily phosphohydrolase
MSAKILQLSDLHVGKSKSESKNLKRIVEKVIKLYQKHKLTILITGDIVDDGQKKQYKEAKNILKPLLNSENFNVWPIPGNQILLFGHEHRHLDFSKTDLSKGFRIPCIFSGGKSTKKSTEYAVNKKGKATKTVLNTGLLGKLIDIDSEGNVSAKTIAF